MNSPFQPKKLNVPGLLGDDALNESLKQFAAQGNAEQAAAPPPSSAVDMADKIQNDYLKAPTPSMRGAVTAALPGPLGQLAGAVGDVATMEPPGPAPVDPQQRAIDVRSDILASIPAPRPLSWLAEQGALTPEQSQAEADARLKEVQNVIAADKASRDFVQNQLDGMTEEERAASIPGYSSPVPLPSEGAPVAALKLTPQEQTLYQHHIDNIKNEKFVRNPDNSISTVYQTSVDIQGKTYNFPTVWDGKILPPHEAVQRALKEKPLDQWPSYKDPAEAEARYGQMHDVMAPDVAGLEKGKTPREQAVEKMAKSNQDAIAATKDPSLQPKQAWWLDAIQSGAKGMIQMGTGTARGAIIATEGLRDVSGIDLITGGGRSNMRAWVDTVDATLDKMMPGDKARSKDFVHQLSQGTGSMVGFMLGGYVGAAFGFPVKATTATIGALSSGAQGFEDAERFNATATQKYLAFIANGALGLTEAVPLDRMFMRAEAMTGGLVSRMLTHTFAGSMEEFTQEFGQAVGTDVVARLLYDEKRKFSLDNYLQQGIIGGITGGLVGAATTALHETGVSTRPAPPEPVDREGFAQSIIDTLQEQLDKLPDVQAHEAATAAEVPLANVVPPEPAAASQVIQGPGGTIPVNANGQFEAHHESGQQLDTIDPARRGTGPLRGGERQRLFGPDAVDRSYFGVGDPNFTRPADQPYKQDTDPYHGEGLGPFRHTVEADPKTIYNWFEDPLNLKSQLDRSTPASEQVTRYEKLIKDAGFKGVYFSESPLGQVAAMFEATKPTKIVDKTSGLVTNFKVPDIAKVPVTAEDVAPLPGLANSPGPVKSVVQAARAYATERGLPVRRQGEYVQNDPALGKRIADAYEKMKHAPNNPRVKAAYKAMADETMAQYQFVKATGLKVEFIKPDQENPYASPKEVLADLQKGHLWVFPTESGFGSSEADVKDNPLLADSGEVVDGHKLVVNDVFRIVHDFFGHGIEGSGFGPRGEENAWQSHMRLYSPAALPAVTSETRGQNSWVNFGPHGEANRANQKDTVYADQKTGIMPSWTWTEGVADDGSEADILARIEKPERVKELTQQIPGLKGVLKHLTPDEQAKLKKQNAAKIVEIFTNLPDAKEMAAVAFAGRAKRGWYDRSAKALVDIFGLQDAPRFAGLLAALSPQTSVESNAINALQTWTNWTKAGRPTDEASIRRILGQSVMGGKGEASVLPAWINNSVTALTEPDAMNITLSGPKVDSFMKNLQGRVIEVTNDAWMANFANVDQTLFAKTGPSPGKGAGYIAMNAVVRKAADVATKMTGETWTPAEIQETVWSWAKTLYEKASAAGENRTAAEIVAAGDMTAEEIGATPDFASLFVSGVYRNILEKGGFNVDAIAASSGKSDGADAGRSDPGSAEGSGLAQGDLDRHLGRAARRLDALRQRRQAAEQDTSVTTDETFFPDTGDAVAARQGELDQLTPEDHAFLDENLLANVGPRPRVTHNADLARPKGGVEGEAKAGELSDVNLAKIGRNFTKLMGSTVRQGRITAKGMAGGKMVGAKAQYDRKQDVIRTGNTGDVSSLVHEGGHDLYYNAGDQLKMFIAGNDVALMKVADDLYGGDTNVMPKATHIAEGFAEFFRVYTLNRAYAENHYGTLVSAFDAVLDKDAPQLKTGLQLVGQQYAAWMQMPSAQVLRNMIVSGKNEGSLNAAMKDLAEAGFQTWMHEYARRAVDASVNRFASLNDLVTQTLNIAQENQGKALDLKRSEDPRVLMRLASNTGARAQVQLTDGVMPYSSTAPATRSLREAMLRYHGKKADQNLFSIDPVRQQDFAAYLVALRGIDEFRRKDEGKINRNPLGDKVHLDELTQTVKQLESQYGTDFSEAAKIVHEYAMGLWQKSYDAGLMTEETYLDGLDRQFYAPLQRDMSDKRTSLGASALTGASKLVKRFKGSDRNIVDPMDVLMHKTFALEKIINRNEVFRTLAKLAERAGKAGAMVERIPAMQLMGKQYTVKEAAAKLTKDDTLTQADAQDLMEILQASIDKENTLDFFRSEPIHTGGENILFGWENGKLAALQLADGDLGADVVNVVNGLGRENLPLFTGLLSFTSTAFRAGIVSWPDFLIANFIKDQFSTFILTDVGYKPFATGVRGMFDELRQANWGKQYNAAMGTMGGMNVANLHDASINRSISALKGKGYIVKSFTGKDNVFLNGIRGLTRVVELSETGTRIGVYKSAYQRAKKDGLSDWDAAIEASYTATDLMDFGLNGSRTALARKTIPFLNAQLQGLYKMARTLGADEVRQRKGLNFAVRAYFKSMKNIDLSRTEKQAIRTGRKAWIKMASLGLISAALHYLFRDDPDYQEAGEYLRTTGWVIPMGDGRLFYIPKPYELAILANFTERALESSEGDEEAMNRFGRGLAMTFVPPMSPPAVTAVVEQVANHDFFTGGQVEPDWMQKLSPELRYDRYTSQFAKDIGSVTGFSPMRVDHLLGNLGATAYRDMMSMYNTSDPNRGTTDISDIPVVRRFYRDSNRGATNAQDFWKLAAVTNGTLTQAAGTYKHYLDGGNEQAANDFLDTLTPDEKAYAVLMTDFKTDAKRLNPFYRARQLASITSLMRREMVTDLGLADTTTKTSDPLKLTAKEKTDLDRALSEYTQREMRNTLVAMQAPGWAGKKMVDTQTTLDLINSIEPRVGEELQRRVAKAKVYDFKTIVDYWPEVKNRLVTDRENSFLDDIVSVAKVMQ